MSTNHSLSINLTKDQTLKLQKLEELATQKRLTYQIVEKELLEKSNENDSSFLNLYTRAKTEFIKAVHEYNSYRSSLFKMTTT